MRDVTIYTDGACSGNPGIGGWCAILMCEDREKILSGYNKQTTNNRMELFAVIEGLAELRVPCKVKIYSDSAYVVNAINEKWLESWEKNNWRSKSKDDVKNVDLWKKLLIEMSKHEVTFIKVKGHSDNEFNNKCDEIARSEIKKASSI